MQSTRSPERVSSLDDGETQGPNDPPRRRRHWWAWGLASLVVVGLVSLAGILWSDYQGTVRVTAATGAPHCKGTTIETFQMTFGSGFVQPAIPMSKGFSCTITVRISNDGDRTVTLGRAHVPVSGPRGGGSFEVTTIGGRPIEADPGGLDPNGDLIDANASLNLTVPPHESQYVQFQVVFRQSGCDSTGTGVSVQPTITVDQGLASHDLTVADFPVFLGTPDSTCSG